MAGQINDMTVIVDGNEDEDENDLENADEDDLLSIEDALDEAMDDALSDLSKSQSSLNENTCISLEHPPVIDSKEPEDFSSNESPSVENSKVFKLQLSINESASDNSSSDHSLTESSQDEVDVDSLDGDSESVSKLYREYDYLY